MPTYLATYDLIDTNPSPHVVFKQHAEKKGWSRWIKATDGRWYRLPNTTLIGSFVGRDAAAAALHSARIDAQQEMGRAISMPKWIIVEYLTSHFDSDETTT